MGPQQLTRRHFTAAARAAASEARRRKREEALPRTTLEVFVVRQRVAACGYGWEIRRFGGVVLDKSLTDYATVQEARFAGAEALRGKVLGA